MLGLTTRQWKRVKFGGGVLQLFALTLQKLHLLLFHPLDLLFLSQQLHLQLLFWSLLDNQQLLIFNFFDNKVLLIFLLSHSVINSWRVKRVELKVFALQVLSNDPSQIRSWFNLHFNTVLIGKHHILYHSWILSSFLDYIVLDFTLRSAAECVKIIFIVLSPFHFFLGHVYVVYIGVQTVHIVIQESSQILHGIQVVSNLSVLIFKLFDLSYFGVDSILLQHLDTGLMYPVLLWRPCLLHVIAGIVDKVSAAQLLSIVLVIERLDHLQVSLCKWITLILLVNSWAKSFDVMEFLLDIVICLFVQVLV